MPLCLDAQSGIEQIMLYPGPCLPPQKFAEEILGDAIVGSLGQMSLAPLHVDLGEVECIIESADVALVDIDPPDPPPGETLFILVRLEGEVDYGFASSDLPRFPGQGDCNAP